MNSEVLQAVIELVGETVGLDLEGAEVGTVAGGCINDAYCLSKSEDETERIFVKCNQASALSMFEAESEGLSEIAGSNTISVPHVMGCGKVGGFSFLCLLYIDLSSQGSVEAQGKMGAQLAAMHRATSNEGRYGWHRDNTIGATPQINDWRESWIDFFTEKRLKYQFELAEQKGHRFSLAEDLLDKVPEFFDHYDPQPSLLHGDLWGGNAGFDENGNPVLFDPAVYFGDRETDLAFTELFGGFGPAFYDAYSAVWPLDGGFTKRKILYNLYHILNHYNLFGGGYAGQAEGMIERMVND